MNKRERELAQRHLAHLEDLRDATWVKVVDPDVTVGKVMPRYDALVYAIGLLRPNCSSMTSSRLSPLSRSWFHA